VSGESIRSPFYLGTITGTSVDGLDMALLDLSNGIRLVAAHTQPFPGDLREKLLALNQPGSDHLDRIGEVDAALGQFIGAAVNDFIAEAGIPPADVAAIGSHGQTVRHRPDLDPAFTWQIGDPNRIAELTGITTVADFRRRDLAAGGQGAPLVPPFHEALFRSVDETRVVVNIGGIANVTVLPSDSTRPITGFDTGPGNCLLDAWCETQTGSPFDEDGAWARSGELQDDLLQAMRWDPYLSRPPPKSTGREYFNLAWLDQYRGTERPEDVQRTLLEFTATSILDAIEEWATSCQRLIVCGGGRLNAYLMERLEKLSASPVKASEAHDFDGDALEAAAFAWLAARRLADQAGNAPAVTGAKGSRVLGAVYPGSGSPE
jgi:anhydro-N-acetylmuramic acid kinase